MKQLSSNKILMRDFELSKDALLDILNNCVKYYLSEEELERFILDYYMKLEGRLNNRYQK